MPNNEKVARRRNTVMEELGWKDVLLIALSSGIASVAVFLICFAFWGQIIGDFFSGSTDYWVSCGIVLLGIGIGFGVSLAGAYVTRRKVDMNGLLAASGLAILCNIVTWTIVAYIYSFDDLAGYSFFEVFAAFPRVITFLAAAMPGGIIFFWVYVQISNTGFLILFLKVLNVHQKTSVMTEVHYKPSELKRRSRGKRQKKKKVKKIKVKKEHYKPKKFKVHKPKKMKYKRQKAKKKNG